MPFLVEDLTKNLEEREKDEQKCGIAIPVLFCFILRASYEGIEILTCFSFMFSIGKISFASVHLCGRKTNDADVLRCLYCVQMLTTA